MHCQSVLCPAGIGEEVGGDALDGIHARGRLRVDHMDIGQVREVVKGAARRGPGCVGLAPQEVEARDEILARAREQRAVVAAHRLGGELDGLQEGGGSVGRLQGRGQAPAHDLE